MSVSVETPIFSALANGVSTVFPYNFTVIVPGDFVLTGRLAGVVTTYTQGVDYTLTGVGTGSGSAVFAVAPANGTVISGYRNTALARTTDYQDNGDLLADVVNDDFDRLYLLLQEIFNGGKGVPTSLRVPNGETVPALPAAADRASRVLATDAAGNFIFIAGVDASSAAALALDLANAANAAKGISLTGYDASIAYASGLGKFLNYSFARTPAEIAAAVIPTNYAYLPGTPERYGAVGDGVANDRAALVACISANRIVNLAQGATYYLGLQTSAAAVFAITGVDGKHIRFNGAKMNITTSGGDFNAGLFTLNNLNGFTLENPWVEDAGFDQTKTFKGVSVVRLHPAAGEVRNVKMRGGRFKNVVDAIDADDATNRAYGLWLDFDIENCVYGINLGNNGDQLWADYRTKNAVRSYFCYGIKTHDFSCVSEGHAAAGNADCLVKCYTAAFPTSDIRGRFISKGSLANTNPQLVFESQNDVGDASITDVSIDFDDTQSPGIVDSVAFRHFSAAGVLQATDPNTKSRIRVTGRASGNIVYSSVPTSSQDHNLDGCQGVFPSFGAYKSAPTLNVTGDGTVLDVIFDIELHDLRGSYNNATGVFTADRDGIYHFSAGLLVQGITAAETRVDIRLVTTPKTFYNTVTNTGNPSFPEVAPQIHVANLYLKKGETAKVQLAVQNGTKIADLFGDNGIISTFFNGGLVRGGPKST